MRRPATRRAAAAAFAVLASLSACGGDSTPGAAADAVPTDGPLPGLPPCGPAPEPLEDPPAVPGLAFPDGAYLTQVTPTDPLINVTGYVELTPIQVRLAFERDDTYEMLVSEDEVVEAELLMTDGTHRTFIKARAVCDAASVIAGVVAPEVDGDSVPVPAGPGGSSSRLGESGRR